MTVHRDDLHESAAAEQTQAAPGDGTSSASAAMQAHWIARQLQTLLPERAERAQSIREQYESAKQQFEQQYSKRREDIDGRLQQQLDEAQQQRDRVTQQAEGEFKRAMAEADRAVEKMRMQLEDKGRENLNTARKKLQEAQWLADTMFEANETQPREQFEQTRSLLEDQTEALDRIESETIERLRRYRQASAVNAPADERRVSIDSGAGVAQLEQQIATIVDEANDHAQRLAKLFLPKLLAGIGPFLIALVLMIAGAAVMFLLSPMEPLPAVGAGAGGGLIVAALLLALMYVSARGQVRHSARAALEGVARGRAVAELCLQQAEQRRERQKAELKQQRDAEMKAAKDKYEPIIEEITRRRDEHLKRIDSKYEKERAKHETRRDEALAEAKRACDEQVRAAKQRHERERPELEQWARERRDEIEQTFSDQFEALRSQWRAGMLKVYARLEDVQTAAQQSSPPWTAEQWELWSPATDPMVSIRFGSIPLDLNALPGGLPDDPELAVDGPKQVDLPALLHVPGECSMLLETDAGDDRSKAIGTVQDVMTRLLTALPPGKVRFVILDPVALGQNFAGFMHLADYEGALVGQRIWTEPQHVQQRLTDLTEHMENVIQKYLRNEFESIAQYNEQAGEIAEPYRFLVIADFPANFTDESTRRLMSIVNSGARCGVHTIIHLDRRQELPRGIDLDDLRATADAHLHIEGGTATWKHPDYETLPLELEPPPGEDLLTRIMQDVGREAVESTRVEVPFEAVTPSEDEFWSRSAAKEVRVPLGRSGASKTQELALGRDTSQHALIAGKTGSGKSTLLHVLITSLALWYRPDEVELYLVDFKKGVEFKTYATHNLPHAKVVAIESDREFGLSVLQKLDAEMKRRGDLFREHNVQGLAGYRELEDSQPMPRILLVIDEFQEFFVEDDRIAQDAALLLDRLVRQGRAFGMHVLLGSQTLGGAYSLARSTIGQMNVRIALQCSESDSYLIMSEENAAARLLSRPGEAIYNDAAGRVEGNSPFQIVWLPDKTREAHLQQVQQLMQRKGYRADQRQVVFEGNTPGHLEYNNALNRLLDADAWPSDPGPLTIWLGDPVAIKEPTAATLRRQSGSNLLIVGQRDEAADALMASALLAAAAQYKPGAIDMYLLDGTPPDAPGSDALKPYIDAIPHAVTVVQPRGVGDVMTTLAEQVKQRHDCAKTNARPALVLINGLHRFRALRHVDDFSFSMDDADKPPSPDKQFIEVLRDGPDVGVHVFAWCDSAANLNRMLERQTLREFELRVLFQMNAADSTALTDTPEASRLGLQRALFCTEDAGVLEKFRPYGFPTRDWLEHAAAQLNQRTAR